MLPSVVEYLYDKLDDVTGLVSLVQPLLTQAVTDNNSSKANGKNTSCCHTDDIDVGNYDQGAYCE